MNKITEWLALVENWLSPPEDSVQLQQWLITADELAYSYEFTDAEEVYVEKILDAYEAQFRRRMALRALPSSSVSAV